MFKFKNGGHMIQIDNFFREADKIIHSLDSLNNTTRNFRGKVVWNPESEQFESSNRQPRQPSSSWFRLPNFFSRSTETPQEVTPIETYEQLLNIANKIRELNQFYNHFRGDRDTNNRLYQKLNLLRLSVFQTIDVGLSHLALDDQAVQERAETARRTSRAFQNIFQAQEAAPQVNPRLERRDLEAENIKLKDTEEFKQLLNAKNKVEWLECLITLATNHLDALSEFILNEPQFAIDHFPLETFKHKFFFDRLIPLLFKLAENHSSFLSEFVLKDFKSIYFLIEPILEITGATKLDNPRLVLLEKIAAYNFKATIELSQKTNNRDVLALLLIALLNANPDNSQNEEELKKLILTFINDAQGNADFPPHRFCIIVELARSKELIPIKDPKYEGMQQVSAMPDIIKTDEDVKQVIISLTGLQYRTHVGFKKYFDDTRNIRNYLKQRAEDPAFLQTLEEWAKEYPDAVSEIIIQSRPQRILSSDPSSRPEWVNKLLNRTIIARVDEICRLEAGNIKFNRFVISLAGVIGICKSFNDFIEYAQQEHHKLEPSKIVAIIDKIITLPIQNDIYTPKLIELRNHLLQ